MTPEEFENLTGKPLASMARNCHVASLALVRALGRGRVARGTCRGVGSQHSWMVDGDDCYSSRAKIIDPTLWSYQEREPYIWTGSARDGLHIPHGAGSIWQYGQPPLPTEKVIRLSAELSDEAKMFMEFAAPGGLDRKGWALLLHAPVDGWPAKEIITAAYQTRELTALIPIDIVGMVTDLNPEQIYR